MKNGTSILEAAPAVAKPELDLSALKAGVPARHTNVTWADYERFLEIIGDRRYRTDYADGEYAILIPLPIHEIWADILGLMIFVLAEELDQPFMSLRGCTWRREDLDKGLEADNCYYLEHEPLVSLKSSFDLTIDPPPDLAIEVEVTSMVGKRMSIYASLRVPEVWRFNEESLIVNRLAENGEYEVVERSRFFPQVPLDELARFVHQFGLVSQSNIIKSFRQWVRQQIAAGWQNS